MARLIDTPYCRLSCPMHNISQYLIEEEEKEGFTDANSVRDRAVIFDHCFCNFNLPSKWISIATAYVIRISYLKCFLRSLYALVQWMPSLQKITQQLLVP